MYQTQVIIGSTVRALALALALLWSNVAGAMPIIVGVEGYVAGILLHGNGEIHENDPISAFYVYDSDAIGTSSPSRISQSYESTGHPYGVYGSVGSVRFAIPDVTIRITNNTGPQAETPCPTPGTPTEDVYSVESQEGGTRIIFILHNCDATAYDVSDFPMEVPSPPVLGTGPGQFLSDRVNFFRTFVDGMDFGTFFRVTGVYRVPEPSSLALLGLGIAGLAFTRRRKP